MMAIRKFWTHPEVPWLLAAGIVLILALLDRFFIRNQASPTDQALDWITILSAVIGSGYSWVVSYRAPLRTTLAPSAALTIRIFLCWMLGPFFVVGAAFAARDIDGGMLLFYLPFFGILLTTFILPFLFAKRRRRRANPTNNAPLAHRKTM
jgi:hypothetical protein